MNSLSVQTGGRAGCHGLLLRGACASDAACLTQALAPLLAHREACLWLDCQQLHALSWRGQRALLYADGLARTAGTTLYWCGLPIAVATQLQESGVAPLLHLLPANAFRGPSFLPEAGAAPVA